MNYAREVPELTDPLSGETVQERRIYYPRVDVTVSCGDGIGKSPAATVEILDKLAAVPVTADNWKLLAAELEYLDIPQKQEIVENWREKFEPVIPPEVTQALESDPVLLEMTEEMIAAAVGLAHETQQAAPVPMMEQTPPAGLGLDLGQMI